MSNITDIEALIESLSPEEIKAVMSSVASKKPTKVDTSRKARRMAITDLYFSVEPKPHHKISDRPMSPEEYSDMRESIRQQVLSGVDLCQN